MSKVASHCVEKFILKAVAADLTGRELAVLMAWFTDAVSYSAAPSVLASRTGIDQTHCRAALKGLCSKSILQKAGKKKVRTKDGGHQLMQCYRLTPEWQEVGQAEARASEAEQEAREINLDDYHNLEFDDV